MKSILSFYLLYDFFAITFEYLRLFFHFANVWGQLNLFTEKFFNFLSLYWLIKNQFIFVFWKKVVRNPHLLSTRPLIRRWKCCIKTYSKSLLKKLGNKTIEKRAISFEAGIGIDLDEPRMKLRINHEVQAKKFKIILFSWLIKR